MGKEAEGTLRPELSAAGAPQGWYFHVSLWKDKKLERNRGAVSAGD